MHVHIFDIKLIIYLMFNIIDDKHYRLLFFFLNQWVKIMHNKNMFDLWKFLNCILKIHLYAINIITI